MASPACFCNPSHAWPANCDTTENVWESSGWLWMVAKLPLRKLQHFRFHSSLSEFVVAKSTTTYHNLTHVKLQHLKTQSMFTNIVSTTQCTNVTHNTTRTDDKNSIIHLIPTYHMSSHFSTTTQYFSIQIHNHIVINVILKIPCIYCHHTAT